MEILRYKSDVWGQRVLEGASWDLIWVFVVAAVVGLVFGTYLVFGAPWWLTGWAGAVMVGNTILHYWRKRRR